MIGLDAPHGDALRLHGFVQQAVAAGVDLLRHFRRRVARVESEGEVAEGDIDPQEWIHALLGAVRLVVGSDRQEGVVRFLREDHGDALAQNVPTVERDVRHGFLGSFSTFPRRFMRGSRVGSLNAPWSSWNR